MADGACQVFEVTLIPLGEVGDFSGRLPNLLTHAHGLLHQVLTLRLSIHQRGLFEIISGELRQSECHRLQSALGVDFW